MIPLDKQNQPNANHFIMDNVKELVILLQLQINPSNRIINKFKAITVPITNLNHRIAQKFTRRVTFQLKQLHGPIIIKTSPHQKSKS